MEQKMVNLKIDNIPVSVPAGTTVLEAARNAGIKIPSLCFLKDINEDVYKRQALSRCEQRAKTRNGANGPQGRKAQRPACAVEAA